MTSLTTIVRRRRKMKRASRGQARKRFIRKLGSTPPFSIHPEQETAEEREKREKFMKRR